MSAITKDQLCFDPAAAADGDNIGAYLRSSDGTLIDKVTTTDTLDRLATASALFDSAGNGITSTGGALDVNIASSSALGIFAEDSAHSTGALGQLGLAVRNDANSSLVDTDGDYAPLQVNSSGELKVASTVTVQAGDAEFLEDTAHTDGDALIHVGAVRQDTLASSVSADGDYASFKVDSLGRLYVAAAISGDVADDDVDSGNPLKVGSRAFDGALTTISASNDRADLLSDMYRRVYVNTSPNIGLQSTSASITATAAQVMGTPLGGRRRVLIQNVGNNEVYLGGSSVSTANGVLLRKRTSVELELGEDIGLFAVCDTAESSELRLLEIA